MIDLIQTKSFFSMTFLAVLFKNVLFGTALTLISTAIFLRFTNWFARQLDGTGALPSYTFAYAAFSAPLIIIYPLFYWFTLIRWLYIFYHFYTTLLSVIAVKAVHKLNWEKAIVSQFLTLLTTIPTIVEQFQLMD